MVYYGLQSEMTLQQIVHDIRVRVIRNVGQRATPTVGDRALLPVTDDIARLRLSYEQLFASRNSVGRMPPSPNTLRAKASAILVRMVQRMLFWYTPQIQRFHHATTAVAENVCSAMEKQTAALQRLYAEVEEVRSEMRVRSVPIATQCGPMSEASTAHEAGFNHFLFALQSKVMDTEAQHVAELQEYVAVIEGLAPPLPGGLWLDLACGRGDWLKTIRSGGREGIGLESNTAALSHCESLGLNVVGSEPVAYLRDCAESSFAVISAFHILNRYSARSAFELIREAVRVLKPDGVLILESTNPASLVAGAREAWLDPTHLRPMPAFTTEFMLQYFGLRMIVQKTLNAIPEEQHLPFAQLDLVRQLNSLLYGPRTYGFVARRSAVTRELRDSNGQGA
jgi:ubiquinone/menaquinone biosynthesis C-methylase UbiE